MSSDTQNEKNMSQSLKANTLQRDNINGNSKSMNAMRSILLSN